MESTRGDVWRGVVASRLVVAALAAVYLAILLLSGAATLINPPSSRLIAPMALPLVALLPPSKRHLDA